MDSRRIVALASLGLVGAVVIGLVATAGDNSDDVPLAAEPAAVAEDADLEAEADSNSSSTSSALPVAETPPADTSASEAAAEPTAEVSINPLVPDLANRGPHPPLLEIDDWLQSDITSLAELRGKVVAVQFWTFGCHNCKATIPHMQALYEKYSGDDFEIVGVHAPEFDFERDPDAIAEAVSDLGVSWPVALDTEKKSFRSWQTDRRFWPRLYLIDQDGNIRYDKIGEGKYDVIDAAVGALIDEGN